MGPFQVSSSEVFVTPLNKKEVAGLGAEEEEGEAVLSHIWLHGNASIIMSIFCSLQYT